MGEGGETKGGGYKVKEGPTYYNTAAIERGGLFRVRKALPRTKTTPISHITK